MLTNEQTETHPTAPDNFEKPKPNSHLEKRSQIVKAIENSPALQVKEILSGKSKHNFQSILNENTNSWNLLNESSSPSTDEDELLSNKTQEHPIFIFPPDLDYPEHDMHQFYYPRDFPEYSHLQIVCSFFRLNPYFKQVISSLEYYEIQKTCPAKRPLEYNLKKDPFFMTNLSKYAKFYVDYDLQDPDNQASKQYIFIDSKSGNISIRRKRSTQKTSIKQALHQKKEINNPSHRNAPTQISTQFISLN